MSSQYFKPKLRTSGLLRRLNRDDEIVEKPGPGSLKGVKEALVGVVSVVKAEDDALRLEEGVLRTLRTEKWR